MDKPDNEEQAIDQPSARGGESRPQRLPGTEMPPKLALFQFVRMCTLQFSSNMSYALEIIVVIPTLSCYEFSLGNSMYLWAIPSLVGLCMMPALRNCFRRISHSTSKQNILITGVCILQVICLLTLLHFSVMLYTF